MTKGKSYNKEFFTKLTLALLLVIIAIAVSFYDSSMIPKFAPVRPPLSDVLFSITPYLAWTQYFTDYMIILIAILLAIYIFPHRIKQLPQVIAAFGTIEIVRGFLIIATPLGSPARPDIHYGITPFLMNGMFPSGHVAVVFLAFLFIQRKEAPILHWIAFGAILVEIIALILSRGHYTIDIVGGLMLSYVTYTLFKKYHWFEIK